MTLGVLSPADQDKVLDALASAIVDVMVATYGPEQGCVAALAAVDRICARTPEEQYKAACDTASEIYRAEWQAAQEKPTLAEARDAAWTAERKRVGAWQAAGRALRVREHCAAAGITADSPAGLSPEAEQLAVAERADYDGGEG